MVTKQRIIDELEALPSETLPELGAFIEYLQFKSTKQANKPTKKTKHAQWQAALHATFGMWGDQVNDTNDAVTYVQNVRRGHRLNELWNQTNEAD
ncbi:MAG: hypothetical protein KDE56_11860 [Anaerolineales bacterium]|nr:hypothetical protein [Anaerolineales bacterium]